jgi:gliding motility-associated-like protein
MSNLFRILLFVPPMFLFVLPVFSQLSGTFEQNPADGIYTVSVIPSVTWAPPLSNTQGATLVLRAATGKLQVANFQTITGSWSAPDVYVAPVEAPAYDYFVFNEVVPISNVTYTSGVKLPMFSFKNALSCTPIELVNNQTDPLNVEPNSIGFIIENFFLVAGAGSAGGNAYAGNDAQSSVLCPPLTLNCSSNMNPVRCFGDVADLTLVATDGSAPYTIQWKNNSTGETGTVTIQNNGGSATLTGMPAANYDFTITDATNNAQTINYLLAQPALPLTVELDAFSASCTGSMDGGVVVDKAKGGTVAGGYHYTWAGYPLELDSALTFVPVGTYSVTVTDDNGCFATGSASVISLGEIELSNTTVKNVLCNGASNGLIDIFPVTPTFNTEFDFTWSSNVPTANESAAYHLGPGTYSVTITDVVGGCVKVESFTINEPPAIELDYRLTEPKCYGEQGLLEIIGISNAVEPWLATIEGGESEIQGGDKFLLEPGFPMKLVVKDAKGCTAEEDFIVAARQELQLEVGESREIKYGEHVDIDAEYFPFSNVAFNWTPSEGLSCTDCPNPVATPIEGVVYRLEMTDSAGCSIDDYISIAVRKSRDIYIPNTFSPNHDGINDSFYPYGGKEIVAIHTMQVFDRWGGKMFQSQEKFKPNDETAGWDGSAREKPALPGTYLYTMNVEFIDGEIILFSGEVNLMK